VVLNVGEIASQAQGRFYALCGDFVTYQIWEGNFSFQDGNSAG